MLLRLWRLLFHARVHVALQQCREEGRLSAANVAQRIDALGPIEFDEIRSVLRQERFLLPPYDDESTYLEFVAVYLELKYFAPGLLAVYFPGIESFAAVDRIVERDLEAEEIYLDSWPSGAPDPASRRPLAALLDAADEELPPEGEADDGGSGIVRPPSERLYIYWMASAERAAAAGNLAGAAIRRARAVARAPQPRRGHGRDRPAERHPAAGGPLAERAGRRRRRVARLARGAAGFGPAAPRGLWTVEARLLYDLQKAYIDHERGVFRIDLLGWARSLGRRPIKRSLPNQGEVLLSRHLARAMRRLSAVRVAERPRRLLFDTLHGAMQREEGRLRARFGPPIAETLQAVGLRPQNLPERVAAGKLVEELLDRILDRGFVTISDLRDAVSRNNVKQPDCAAFGTFFHGDALLRADRRLAAALDGVYHPGEAYLRGIQRVSLLAFGTHVGRFITQYLAVPFGGSYVVLAGLAHLIEFAIGVSQEWARAHLGPWLHFSTLVVGLFVLGLMHVPRYREEVWKIVKTAGQALRLLCVDSLRWLLRIPWVQRLLSSRWARLVLRFLLKPLAPTALVWWTTQPGYSGWHALAAAAVIFLGWTVVLNSRLGRDLEEMTVDALVEGWHRFGLRLLHGLFRLVMDLFRRLLQTVERLLYTVDEWLRFKTGENDLTLSIKAVLGVGWSLVSYVVRFCVNLLIEPQLNPIKHFPVVTVSHKIMFPLLFPPLHSLLLQRMDKATASLAATILIAGIPGFFGFLVWELKENWRLFAANRPRGLQPVPVGQHGETLPRLLRPGFHSGTVPKRFAKLRRAARHALADGDSAALRKHREALGHVERDVRRYVQRELVALVVEVRPRRPRPPRSTGSA